MTCISVLPPHLSFTVSASAFLAIRSDPINVDLLIADIYRDFKPVPDRNRFWFRFPILLYSSTRWT